MVAPVVEWQARLASPLLAVTLFYLFSLVIVPVIAVGAAAALSQRWGGARSSSAAVATRFVYALVPLGFGMWLAHYGYHFVTSYDAIVPVVERWFGEPSYMCDCFRPVADWLPRLEILCLDGGLLLSLYTAYRIALSHSAGVAHALRILAPWAVLLVLLFAVGVWIVLQPMQMRGTLLSYEPPGLSRRDSDANPAGIKPAARLVEDSYAV